MLRPKWILAFGLALLCTPAQAVPCLDDSCQKQADRDDSSIQLNSPERGVPLYDGASPILVDDLPPGRFESDELPPGLREDWRAHEWRDRISTRLAVPMRDPRSTALPIPEATGLVIFVASLLIARAAVRHPS